MVALLVTGPPTRRLLGLCQVGQIVSETGRCETTKLGSWHVSVRHSEVSSDFRELSYQLELHFSATFTCQAPHLSWLRDLDGLSSSAMSSTVVKGNCHCGAYRFEVRLAKLDRGDVVKCDCGLCGKKGCLWLCPGDDGAEMVVERDEGRLVRYRADGGGEHEVGFAAAGCSIGWCVC